MSYQIKIENDQALVSWKNNPAVTIPLEPLPAEKFASGYTHAAWIWCALHEALETASLSIPDHDLQEIAILISRQSGPSL